MARLGFIIAALALAACASTDPATDQAEATAANGCFRSADVNGYNVIDRSHVRVSVGASHRYVLTTMWDTHDLDWTEAIALRTATGRVCTGNGLGVELIGGVPRRRYPIVSVEREPETAPQGS